MINRLKDNMVRAKGTYVFLLFLFIAIFIASAYSASDVLFTSRQDRLLATSYEGHEESISTNSPPTISIIGSQNISISVGDTFVDPGATAYDSEDGDLTSSLLIYNNVDTSAAGHYIVSYNIFDSGGDTAEIVRQVEVVGPPDESSEPTPISNDDNTPTIIVEGDSYITINVGDTYVDQGVTAFSDDGTNLSDYIVTNNMVDANNPGTYTVRYELSDSLGNMIYTERTVEVVGSGESDNTTQSSSTSETERSIGHPTITMIGSDKIVINIGDTYIDEGATAYDNEDGDLTSSLLLYNNVDTSTAGYYIVSYNIFDGSGGTAEIVRQVEVRDPDVTHYSSTTPVDNYGGIYDSDGNYIGTGEYTTFDGGSIFDEDGNYLGSIFEDNGVFYYAPSVDGERYSTILTTEDVGKPMYDERGIFIGTGEFRDGAWYYTGASNLIDDDEELLDPLRDITFEEDQEIENAHEEDDNTIIAHDEVDSEDSESTEHFNLVEIKEDIQNNQTEGSQLEKYDIVKPTSLSATPIEYTDDDFEIFYEEENEENLAAIQEIVDEIIKEETHLFERRENVRLSSDSDQDGITDYDEVVIYGTNPFNARTIDGELSDGEKILSGIDPLSYEEEPIRFENPQATGTAPVIEELTVQTLVVTKTETSSTTQEEIVSELSFTGTALPNSFVTLYIFSTPIIVTVKTDANGIWIYKLDKELDDGQHEMYVATVDNSGKIVAKSAPIPFVKVANAAELGTTLASPEDTAGFLRGNFVIFIVLIAIVGVAVMILLVGGDLRKSRLRRNNLGNNATESSE